MILRRAFIGVVLSFLFISGCTRIGPDMVHTDRFDYTTAVADSWNEQVLLNIVRVKAIMVLQPISGPLILCEAT